jgi:hypothetical protein
LSSSFNKNHPFLPYLSSFVMLTSGHPRLPRRQLRKVPEPGTETCVILFRGRPGVQETSVSGGVTAVCVVFPV